MISFHDFSNFLKMIQTNLLGIHFHSKLLLVVVIIISLRPINCVVNLWTRLGAKKYKTSVQ